MNDVDDQFDDPVLKEAVRRAWGGENAPAGLAARILAALPVESATSATVSTTDSRLLRLTGAGRSNASGPRSISPWRVHWRLTAALAASLLLAIGWIGWLANYQRHFGDETDRAAMAMMLTHDMCCGLPDHHFVKGVPPNDLDAIAAKTGTDLSLRVLTVAPADGWTFAGAGECAVGHFTSVHLLYRKGKEAISVFSMPAQDFKLYTADGSYATDAQNHLAAGFVYDHAIYCIVTNPMNTPLTMSDITELRNRIEQAFTTHQPAELNVAAGDEPSNAAYAIAGE